MIGATTNTINDVWGTSSSDVFAVGHLPGTTLHYNGRTWNPMTSSTQDTIESAWGDFAIRCFRLGGDSSGGSIILHYNGKTWSTMTDNVPTNLFLKVWGTSSANVFAVDSQGTIVHYCGQGLE